MITAIVYDTATGIGSHKVVAQSQAAIDLQANIGQAVYMGEFDIATEFLDPNNGYTVMPRPLMNVQQDKLAIASDGVDTITISNIPNGAECSHPEGSFVATPADNTATWSCNTPGTYLFVFRLAPYQDCVVYVEVI